MKQKSLKKYEKEIKALRRHRQNVFSPHDLFVSKVIEKVKSYFEIYDETENKNLLVVFEALFINTNNIHKTLSAIGFDMGYSPRSIMRQKKKVLTVYACIYEKLKKVP